MFAAMIRSNHSGHIKESIQEMARADFFATRTAHGPEPLAQ